MVECDLCGNEAEGVPYPWGGEKLFLCIKCCHQLGYATYAEQQRHIGEITGITDIFVPLSYLAFDGGRR